MACPCPPTPCTPYITLCEEAKARGGQACPRGGRRARHVLARGECSLCREMKREEARRARRENWRAAWWRGEGDGRW